MNEMSDPRVAGASARPDEVRVWDPLVRVFHWSLVTLFAVAYISEGEPMWLHSWAGYVIAGLLALRIVWGLVGPRHARFTDFIYRPSTVLAYARDLVAFKSRRYVGHSPGGGAMIVVLIVVVALTAGTGMATLAVDKGQGPLAPWLAPAATAQTTQAAPAMTTSAPAGGTFAFVTAAHADEAAPPERRHQRSAFREVHEFLANLSFFLVIFHVAAVLFVSLAHRENLVFSMIHGRKRAADDSA